MDIATALVFTSFASAVVLRLCIGLQAPTKVIGSSAYPVNYRLLESVSGTAGITLSKRKLVNSVI